MKFILIIEDTVNGIRCRASFSENGVTDALAQSLSGKVVANFSESLKELEASGALYVEKE
jgi:hypothetical protein